jgi:hypothetical protein
VNIYQTGFGKYLHMTTSYFALMRESPYVKDHLHAPMPEWETANIWWSTPSLNLANGI